LIELAYFRADYFRKISPISTWLAGWLAGWLTAAPPRCWKN